MIDTIFETPKSKNFWECIDIIVANVPAQHQVSAVLEMYGLYHSETNPYDFMFGHLNYPSARLDKIDIRWGVVKQNLQKTFGIAEEPEPPSLLK